MKEVLKFISDVKNNKEMAKIKADSVFCYDPQCVSFTGAGI